MREYYLYKIREDVAHEFYGKESKIFSLFLEERKSRSMEVRNMLQKQISYITVPVSTEELKVYLSEQRVPGAAFDSASGVFTICLSKSEVQLYLTPDYLILTSTGSYDAETAMFEVLRKFETRFLAMDYDSKKYGWLFPVKLNTFYGT
ncbi:sporulation inhibitor of replication protein SirA [Fictibacillus aquaticus]|uniref:Sporulation inhibitor of replication protein SirA n=1 Tax=Fictibacillus aquaticus TaxID=2021314 RepID=A0A235FBN5_9BACL|nr:sporulation inhibitor of replication protein SirA [Fictibacillus aquaticus]OYD58758.1 hypothetical protein CGZ90_02330 [Fictibacillus aquaticus]